MTPLLTLSLTVIASVMLIAVPVWLATGERDYVIQMFKGAICLILGGFGLGWVVWATVSKGMM